MQSNMEANIIVVRLMDGEDLFSAIETISKKYRINSGMILSGIGMIQDFELNYFDGTKYKMRKFGQPHELVSMHGSIAYAGNKLILHIHCGVANSKHQLYGGHLSKATVKVLNELIILKLSKILLTRKLNEKTGLMELAVE